VAQIYERAKASESQLIMATDDAELKIYPQKERQLLMPRAATVAFFIIFLLKLEFILKHGVSACSFLPRKNFLIRVPRGMSAAP
jgi:hypothetical protein